VSNCSPCIRCCVGCALIIPMIIQTILLDPSGAVWTDEASNLSSLDPSGAVQVDAEHPARNRKVVGSNPTSGSKTAAQSICAVVSSFALLVSLIILCARPRPREARPASLSQVCRRWQAHHP
jgi:hypothetical protein